MMNSDYNLTSNNHLTSSARRAVRAIRLVSSSCHLALACHSTMSNKSSLKFLFGVGDEGPISDMNHSGVAFDSRGYLLACDYRQQCIRVLSCIDGLPITTFTLDKRFKAPSGIAFDPEHQRVLVSFSVSHGILALSLPRFSLEFSAGNGEGRQADQFAYPAGLAIDHRRQRIIVADAHNSRLQILSLLDGSFIMTVGESGSGPLQFRDPRGVCVDHRLDRVIVAEANNHRVQVLSACDYSFEFAFGTQGWRPGEFDAPSAVCVDTNSRILVADYTNMRLQAFTSDGAYISMFDCFPRNPCAVAYLENRGLIAYAAEPIVAVIPAYRWLPFVWRADLHRHAPQSIRRIVHTITMLRSIAHWSALSYMPNELLFEVFAGLDVTNAEDEPEFDYEPSDWVVEQPDTQDQKQDEATQQPPPSRDLPRRERKKCLLM